MTSFETRLLDELQQIVALQPTPARARPRRPPAPAAAAAALLVAIVAAVLVISSAGGGTEAAYAVAKTTDGMVTVQIRSLRDAAGLERKLADVGVPAKVDYLDPGTTCAPGRFHTAGGPGKLTMGSGRTAAGTTTFTVDPGEIGAGKTLVVTASEDGGLTNVSTAVADGAVGACVPVTTVGTGPSAVPQGSGPSTAPAPGRSQGTGPGKGLESKGD